MSSLIYKSVKTNTTSDESNNGPTLEANISEEERLKYLQELQAQTTLAMIPALIFVILMAVIGVIGNSLVLYVYSRKFILNGTRVFILVIAAFDLVTNVIGIPGEIYGMLHVWNFDQPWLCKLRLCTNVVTTMVSAKMLLALAVVRYRKVCVTFGWQISARQAKIIAAILVFTSLLFSAPSAVINGRLTRKTPRSDIYGYECTVDDAYVNTVWPLAFSAFFIFLFTASCFAIVFLYALVGAKALRHNRAIRKGTYVSSAEGPSSSDGAVITSSTLPVKFTIGGITEDKHPKKDGKLNLCMEVATSVESDTCSNERELEKDKYKQEDESGQRNDGDKVTNTGNLAGGTSILVDPVRPEWESNLRTVQELTRNLDAEQKQESRQGNEEQSKKLETEEGNKGTSSHKEELEKEKCHLGKGIGTFDVISMKNRAKTVHFYISEPFKEVNKLEGFEDALNNEEIAGLAEEIRSCKEDVLSEARPTNTDLVLDMNDSRADKNKSEATGSDKHFWIPKFDFSEELAKGNSHAEKPQANFSDRTEEAKNESIQAMELMDIAHCWNRHLESDAQIQEEIPIEEMHLKPNSLSCTQDDSFHRENRNFMKSSSETSSRPRKNEVRKEKKKKSCFSAIPRDLAKDDANNHSSTNVNDSGNRSLNRTTIMLITISAVYIIGFIPYLALVSYYNANPEAYVTLDGTDLVFYHLFVRSPFLNCAANVVIYGICDLTFRRKCVNVIRQKLLCFRS